MSIEHDHRSIRGWFALAIVCGLLLALAVFFVTRSRSSRSALITIDSNGTTRFGPLPLRNTNLRSAAFTAVGYLNNGTASLSVAESAKIGDIAANFDAMRKAGITSVTFHVTGTNK